MKHTKWFAVAALALTSTAALADVGSVWSQFNGTDLRLEFVGGETGAMKYAFGSSRLQLGFDRLASSGPPALTVLPGEMYGNATLLDFRVPAANRMRNGCFLSTPRFLVAHAKGSVERAFPTVHVNWTETFGDPAIPYSGFQSYRSMSDADVRKQALFRIQVEAKKPDGRRVLTRVYQGVGALNPDRAVHQEGLRTFSVRQKLDGALFAKAGVDELDEVRVSICDVRQNVALTVDRFEVETRPAPVN